MSHMTGLPEMPIRRIEAAPRGLGVAVAIMVLLGVATFATALMTDPARAWRAYHFNWLYFTLIATGAVLLAVVVSIAKGMWSRPVRRIALAFVAFLPIAYLLMLPIVTVGATHIFPWMHDAVHKEAYLNQPFLIVRQMVLLGVLFGLSLAFAYWSLRPDLGLLRERTPESLRGLYDRMTRGWEGQAAEEAKAFRRLSVLGPATALAYAVALGVLGWDFVMSLEPHWFSTLLGPYVFMGGFLTGLMTLSLLVIWLLRTHSLYDWVLPTTLHDLGKLCFGFTVFWAYLFYSQFIVIWYGMLPFEQAFINHRFDDPFRIIAILVGLMVFVIPFFGLMGVQPKKTPAVFAGFAIVSLTGMWLERYLLVYPSHYFNEASLPIGWIEVGMALPFAGLLLGSVFFFLTRFPLFQLWIPQSELELEGLDVPVEAPQDTDRVISRDL
jgi:MFS family permease